MEVVLAIVAGVLLVLFGTRGALVAGAPSFFSGLLLQPSPDGSVCRPASPKTEAVSAQERKSLRLAARRTWRFFEVFVSEEDHYLPPDNFQEDPEPRVAHRTSPTNMGLCLLTALAAHDFGWIGIVEAAERIERTLHSMDRLEKFRGHFFNWYDTRTLQPLIPEYVSSVDSGNLAGHLLALMNGLHDLETAPVGENFTINLAVCRVRTSVRPVGAALTAAGPDGVRRPSPTQVIEHEAPPVTPGCPGLRPRSDHHQALLHPSSLGAASSLEAAHRSFRRPWAGTPHPGASPPRRCAQSCWP